MCVCLYVFECACVCACAHVHLCVMVCDVSPSRNATAEAFVMGKIHKEIAMFMLEASEDGGRSEQSFVKVHTYMQYLRIQHTPHTALR